MNSREKQIQIAVNSYDWPGCLGTKEKCLMRHEISVIATSVNQIISQNQLTRTALCWLAGAPALSWLAAVALCWLTGALASLSVDLFSSSFFIGRSSSLYLFSVFNGTPFWAFDGSPFQPSSPIIRGVDCVAALLRRIPFWVWLVMGLSCCSPLTLREGERSFARSSLSPPPSPFPVTLPCFPVSTTTLGGGPRSFDLLCLSLWGVSWGGTGLGGRSWGRALLGKSPVDGLGCETTLSGLWGRCSRGGGDASFSFKQK